MNSNESFKRIVIYGGGGLGREVLQTIRDIAAAGNDVACAGFWVDPMFNPPGEICGFPVHKNLQAALADEETGLVIAVGDTAARARIVQSLISPVEQRIRSLIHPRAMIGQTVRVGRGAIVLGVASATCDVRLGRHVLVNPGVTMAHDCEIGDFVSLGPSAALAGGVRVGVGCDIGVGAVFAPRADVGEWSVVGAGAVVLKSHPANAILVGTPARAIKIRAIGWQKEYTQPSN